MNLKTFTMYFLFCRVCVAYDFIIIFLQRFLIVSVNFITLSECYE